MMESELSRFGTRRATALVGLPFWQPLLLRHRNAGITRTINAVGTVFVRGGWGGGRRSATFINNSSSSAVRGSALFQLDLANITTWSNI